MEKSTQPADKPAVVSPTHSDSQIVVVDLGKKQRRKRVRELRRGEGRLVEKVRNVAKDLREQGTVNSNTTLVVVVREKARSRMRFML